MYCDCNQLKLVLQFESSIMVLAIISVDCPVAAVGGFQSVMLPPLRSILSKVVPDDKQGESSCMNTWPSPRRN